LPFAPCRECTVQDKDRTCPSTTTGGAPPRPLLLHTSGNALADLGFSHYEQAVTVLLAINVVTAIVMAFALAGKPHWPADVEPSRAAGR